MVFQQAVLLRRSAAANIRYALDLAGIKGADGERAHRRRARTKWDCARSRTVPRACCRAARSRRLALARAWALAPEVLFLDEPTASLDPAATRAVEDIVRSIHARGTTIVMTTHNLAQAKRLADDIVFLHDGRLCEQSPSATFSRAAHTRGGDLSRRRTTVK